MSTQQIEQTKAQVTITVTRPDGSVTKVVGQSWDYLITDDSIGGTAEFMFHKGDYTVTRSNGETIEYDKFPVDVPVKCSVCREEYHSSRIYHVKIGKRTYNRCNDHIGNPDRLVG